MTEKLTITIEGEAAEKLAELSELSGRSADWYASYMIREYYLRELNLVRQLKAGLERAMAGEGIPHEDVMAEMDALLDKAEAETSIRSGRTAAR